MPNGDNIQITTLGFLTTFAILIGWFPIESASAQEKVEVLKANYKNLDVREGHDFLSKLLDSVPGSEGGCLLYASLLKKKMRITFSLNIDSLSFPTQPTAHIQFYYFAQRKRYLLYSNLNDQKQLF